MYDMMIKVVGCIKPLILTKRRLKDMKKILNTLRLKCLRPSLRVPTLPGLSFRALFGRKHFGFVGFKSFGRNLVKSFSDKNSLLLRTNCGVQIPIPVLT